MARDLSTPGIVRTVVGSRPFETVSELAAALAELVQMAEGRDLSVEARNIELGGRAYLYRSTFSGTGMIVYYIILAEDDEAA